MSKAENKERMQVVFTSSGETREVTLINTKDIKPDGTYLVDQEYDADFIAEVPNDQLPLPKGPWQFLEE